MTTTNQTPAAGARPPRRRAGIGRMAGALTLVASAVTALVGPSGPAAADPPEPPVLPNPNSNGITVVDWDWADGFQSTPQDEPRIAEATVTTSAIFRSGITPEIKVRILLPGNYETDPGPHDVLWLLHGGTGNYMDWSDMNVATHVANSDFDGIVVMPEGGSTGYYTDWYGHADNGASPAWETFHIDQLLPWVDDNFTTDASRDSRAIAGLSMGGFGALKYAGQHPDLFSSVGSFSGPTDLTMAKPTIGGAADVLPTISQHMWASGACIRETGTCLSPVAGDYRVNLVVNGEIVDDEALQADYRMETLFGPRGADPNFYPNANPVEMENVYKTQYDNVALFTGGETPLNWFDDGEKDMYEQNLALNALLQGDPEYHWCAGRGSHSAEYWEDDLVDFLELVYGTGSPCHYVDSPRPYPTW